MQYPWFASHCFHNFCESSFLGRNNDFCCCYLELCSQRSCCQEQSWGSNEQWQRQARTYGKSGPGEAWVRIDGEVLSSLLCFHITDGRFLGVWNETSPLSNKVALVVGNKERNFHVRACCFLLFVPDNMCLTAVHVGQGQWWLPEGSRFDPGVCYLSCPRTVFSASSLSVLVAAFSPFGNFLLAPLKKSLQLMRTL